MAVDIRREPYCPICGRFDWHSEGVFTDPQTHDQVIAKHCGKCRTAREDRILARNVQAR